jgi:hypothetical protein
MSDPSPLIKDAVAPLIKLFSYKPLPPCLYHYTTAAGLLGILRKGENQFWASTVGFSNDASEGRYATKIGLEVVESHPLSQNKSEMYAQTASFVRSMFSPPGCTWEDGYVISFCEEDNVLSQWRAYGGTSGFSIGFRGLSTDSLRCVAGAEMWLVKVEYDPSRQRESLRKCLDSACTILQDDPANVYGVRLASSVLYVLISRWACSVKHEAFREEKEWRVTVFPSYDTSGVAAGAFYGGRPRLAEHPDLREHRGRLLPYVSIKPRADYFDVQSITIGPSKTQALDLKAIELLKEKLGLNAVELRQSDIPLQS